MSASQRYELKFFVPYDQADDLINTVMPYVQPDTHAQIDDGIPRYGIRSVYLDTERHKFYHEKIDGIKDRRKFRVRAYTVPTDDDQVFLEIKYRSNSQVSKDRTRLPLKQAVALFNAQICARDLGLSPAATKAAERYAHFCHLLDLQPMVTVIYDRTPLVGRVDDSIRLTIDVNLRVEDQRGAARLFEPRPVQPVPLPGAILELKFDRLMPDWMRQVIRRFDLRQESISKYGHCMEAVVFRQFASV